MTPTELQLLAIHKGPVPLDDICERYLNLGREEALRRAALNQLPFPTFKLAPSRKAPVLVHLKDLAHHIDESHRCAKESWEHSQV
jgi:hypothetical protein